MGKAQVTPTRSPGLLDGGAPSAAAIPLNDAARRALAILAAGVFASFAATAVFVVLDVHDALALSDLPKVRFLFPSLHPGFFVPEPVERAQVIAFIAGAYIMSLALVLVPALDSRPSMTAGRAFLVMFVVAVIGSLLFGRTYFQEPIRHFSTFRAAWQPEAPALWLAAFATAVSPALIPAGKLRRSLTTLLAAISIPVLALLCARYSFVAPADGLALHIRNQHDSAALHAIVQSSFGQIPYLDFIPQYGGYGLFAVPFFRLGLDPWIALCLFLFVCALVSFSSMGIAVAIASRSWQCGSLAGILMFWLSGLAHSGFSYFQGTPIRTFFPAIYLLLFSLYADFPRRVCAIGGILIPFAVYWNPETGLFCAGAAASFLILDVAVRRNADGSFSREALAPASIFFIACAGTAAVIGAAALAVLERAVPVRDLFVHAALFSQYGFFNLPMPLLDVWVPAAFAFCLLLAFPGFIATTRGGFRARALFGYFCAMLFAALFFYYQGRSYTGNLVGLAFPIACAGFSWLWLDAGPDRNSNPRAFLLSGNSLAVFGFAVASAALAGSPMFKSAPSMNPLAMTMSADNRMLREFIRKESQGYAGAFIISPQAWRLHLLSGVAPPRNLPPQSGLLMRVQEEETIRALDPDSRYAVLVDSQYFSPKARLGSPFPGILLARIDAHWQRGNSLKLDSGELTAFTPKVPPQRGVRGRDDGQSAVSR